MTADPRSELDRRSLGAGYPQLYYLMFMLPVVLDARVIVETGLGAGDSTKIHLAALSEMRDPESRVLHTFEKNGHEWGDVEGAIRAMGFPAQWVVHREDSTQYVNRLDPGTIDYLFLDSDHAYATVEAELRNFAPRLAPHGVIATHDAWPTKDCSHASFIDSRGDDKGRPSTTYWAFKDWADRHARWKLTLLAYPEGLAVLTRERERNQRSWWPFGPEGSGLEVVTTDFSLPKPPQPL